jgi:hypothetical protein
MVMVSGLGLTGAGADRDSGAVAGGDFSDGEVRRGETLRSGHRGEDGGLELGEAGSCADGDVEGGNGRWVGKGASGADGASWATGGDVGISGMGGGEGFGAESGEADEAVDWGREEGRGEVREVAIREEFHFGAGDRGGVLAWEVGQWDGESGGRMKKEARSEGEREKKHVERG